jgi:hypothetical protein
MQTNCAAIAKVVVNKKVNTIRLLFSFDLYNKVSQRTAALVTGDLCDKDDANKDVYVAQALARAKEVLRTNNIIFVE